MSLETLNLVVSASSFQEQIFFQRESCVFLKRVTIFTEGGQLSFVFYIKINIYVICIPLCLSLSIPTRFQHYLITKPEMCPPYVCIGICYVHYIRRSHCCQSQFYLLCSHSRPTTFVQPFSQNRKSSCSHIAVTIQAIFDAYFKILSHDAEISIHHTLSATDPHHMFLCLSLAHDIFDARLSRCCLSHQALFPLTFAHNSALIPSFFRHHPSFSTWPSYYL